MGSQTLVVIGASGDLAGRLLFPALLSLEYRERLEDLKVIGYARQEWSTEEFHEHLRNAMEKHVDASTRCTWNASSIASSSTAATSPSSRCRRWAR